jgi:hypothetical protein
MFIEFEDLGVGTVQTGFRINDIDIVAHKFFHSNDVIVPYMRTPNLPMRWEIENLAALSVAPEMDAICCTIISEGGTAMAGFGRAWGVVPGVSVSGAGTIKQIIAFRLKGSHNRATVFPKQVSLLSTTAANYRWIVSINPTFTGGIAASWQSVPNSALEFDTTRDGTILSGANEGIVLACGFGSNNTDGATETIESFLTIGSDFDGVPDELVISVQNTAQPAETYFASLRWLEAP